MPVYAPRPLDIETIVGVAITLLAVLAVQVAFRRRERRKNSARGERRTERTRPNSM